jgi:hypothetical protein
MYATWAIACARVHQQLYHPEQPFLVCPQPPILGEEVHAMMILWIARERQMFEMEMQEFECLLGLRGVH